MSESVEIEPSSFEEAMQKIVWVDSIVEKYDSIIRNNVWEVVPRPVEKSMVSSWWLYKVKKASDGSVKKQKARVVAKGFSQMEGIYYKETFTLVARYSSIESILSLSTQMGWKIHHMDVKTTLLNRVLRKRCTLSKRKDLIPSTKIHMCVDLSERLK